MPILAVAIGGALGAVLRYSVIQHLVMRLHPQPFPLGTLLVNVLGAFLIGALMAKYAAGDVSDNTRLLLATGLLGGFTTFSAFSWDALELFQRGQMLQACGYIAASVVLSLVACAGAYSWLR